MTNVNPAEQEKTTPTATPTALSRLLVAGLTVVAESIEARSANNENKNTPAQSDAGRVAAPEQKPEKIETPTPEQKPKTVDTPTNPASSAEKEKGWTESITNWVAPLASKIKENQDQILTTGSHIAKTLGTPGVAQKALYAGVKSAATEVFIPKEKKKKVFLIAKIAKYAGIFILGVICGFTIRR